MHSESPFESFLVWLFLACGWYGTLGRVVNFEMCHLRSLGRVANFKNDAFPNGGIGFDLLASLTCCTCCRMIIGGGWGGCINILDEHFPYGTEHVHVAHAVVWSSGGWGGVLTSFTSTSFTLRNMETPQKIATYVDATPKNNSVPKKKIRLGLQLDMASQCRLVAVCGFCVATSALALKRREEEKTGWVNIALIWFGWLKIIEF